MEKEPEQVTFKANVNAVAVNYSNETITAFGVEDYGNYCRYAVAVRYNNAPINIMLDYVDTSAVTKIVFLRKIVTGKKISLLGYEDDKKEIFFVAEGSSLPYELKGYQHNTFGASL